MDKIKQYHDLTEIRPDYHKLNIPLQKLSIKRVRFNKQELELHYNEEFGIYISKDSDILEEIETTKKTTKNASARNKPIKKGGSEIEKITVIDLDLFDMSAHLTNC